MLKSHESFPAESLLAKRVMAREIRFTFVQLLPTVSENLKENFYFDEE